MTDSLALKMAIDIIVDSVWFQPLVAADQLCLGPRLQKCNGHVHQGSMYVSNKISCNYQVCKYIVRIFLNLTA